MNTDTGVYAIKPLVPYNHGLTSSMLRPSTGCPRSSITPSGQAPIGLILEEIRMYGWLNLSYEARNLSCDSVSERTVTVWD